MKQPDDLTPGDQDLLEEFRLGNPAAVGNLYRRYCRPLYLYAHSLTRDAVRAEDIVQQAFVRLLQQDPRTVQSVRGLLYAVTRNLIRDDDRRDAVSVKSFPRLASVPELAPPGPEESERLEMLSRALHELPAEQREVVILRIHAGLPFAEIARTAEISEATAKSRYRYALEKLGERLELRGGRS